MVGVGFEGKQHMLARVSIVNSHGHVVYDSFVAPQEKVVDYRTSISGVKPADLKNGKLLTLCFFTLHPAKKANQSHRQSLVHSVYQPVIYSASLRLYTVHVS